VRLCQTPNRVFLLIILATAKLPKPSDDTAMEDTPESTVSLPQALVRIPTEHAPTLQAQAEAIEAEAAIDDSTMST
jgi:DASH complex subunit DAD2